MPATFCLDDNFDETLAFLARLRSHLLDDAMLRQLSPNASPAKDSTQRPARLRSYIDFGDMRRITTTAALIMAALYHRKKFITGRRLWTVDEQRWKPEVVDMLLQVGFKELLQMKERKGSVVQRGATKTLQFLSGELADGPSVGKLQQSLLELLSSDEQEQLLDIQPYGGIFEAILNSHEHAYPNDQAWDHAPLKCWWITGSVDSEKGLVTVVAYDQGISIPASLPRWEHFGRVRRLMGRLAVRAGLKQDLDSPTYDGVAIRLAMVIARSSTGLAHRGKGLNTLLEVAQRASWGRLRVLSRNGEFVWTTGQRSQTRSHAQSIGGTLVEWQLRLR